MKNWLLFGIGLALGIAGTILAPRYAATYLPGVMDDGAAVEGTVVAKQREPDRLLMTLRTSEGGVLVTFTEKVADIDLLVEHGDRLTLALGAYEPFVNNPVVRRVQKPERPNLEPKEERSDFSGSTFPLSPPEPPRIPLPETEAASPPQSKP